MADAIKAVDRLIIERERVAIFNLSQFERMMAFTRLQLE